MYALELRKKKGSRGGRIIPLGAREIASKARVFSRWASSSSDRHILERMERHPGRERTLGCDSI